MKFKLVTDRVVEWPVVIKVPVNGGATQDQRMTAHFKIVDMDRFRQLTFDNDGDDIDRDLLREVLVNWGDDVCDEDDKPLPFSHELREQLISSIAATSALVKAYSDVINGRKLKN